MGSPGGCAAGLSAPAPANAIAAAAYGVMVAHEAALEVVRPAPRQAMRLPTAVWVALARARVGSETGLHRRHRHNLSMPSTSVHRAVAADVHHVPKPFRAFAVRSDEPQHAFAARAPYGRVHIVHTNFLDAGSLASLSAEGCARVNIEAVTDVDYAATTLEDLAAAAPRVQDLVGDIAAALQLTRVLGDNPACYRRSVATRIDYLASRGAGFHNDVSRHWSRCLFWVLALAAGDVEFVLPHAGVRLALVPGALLVFDQTMAHGLCRPGDGGQSVAASFEAGEHRHQIFLTGELLLTDAQWAVLGAPWRPVEEHESRGALDLMVAQFDERSGAFQGLRALRDGMKRSTCHVDEAGG